GIRDGHVTGVQTCALPILLSTPRLANRTITRTALPEVGSFWICLARSGAIPPASAGEAVPPPQRAATSPAVPRVLNPRENLMFLRIVPYSPLPANASAQALASGVITES